MKYIVKMLFICGLALMLFPISHGNPDESEQFVQSSDQEAFSGYLFYAPVLSKQSYLLDEDFNTVHTWPSDYNPGRSAYLCDNGDIIRSIYIPGSVQGGSGGGVQRISWNGELLWHFEYCNSEHLQHHDVEPLPNGNVLLIASEYYSASEAIAQGANPDLLSGMTLWVDHIIEVKPVGKYGGDIVWEWHAWDHLIQDYDASKPNYGVVADHPELIDLNYWGTETIMGGDWTHINSIDYHQGFDQILVSVRNFNEIWVIDHSTSTSEASGHSGGNAGMGGDLLYRWGNPEAYQLGDDSDQQFFQQHDARWVLSDYPGAGNILVFNNGIDRPGETYSTIDEITPAVDSQGNYQFTSGEAFAPETLTWSYSAPDPSDLFQERISGCQRLPSGNTLICEGLIGRFSEVTEDKQVLWTFDNPYPIPSTNNVFTLRHYPLEFLNVKPNKPSNPVPAHTDTQVGVDVMLSWNCSDFDDEALHYDVYFGTDNIPDTTELLSRFQQNQSYHVSNLSLETTYYWQIVVHDDEYAVEGPIWRFTTKQNSPPLANFSYEPNLPKPGEIVQFYDNSVDAENNVVNFTWEFDDGTVIFEKNPTFMFSEEGNYSVSLTVTDAYGQMATISKNVSVFWYDDIPPDLTIVHPANALYVMDTPIFPWVRPLVIGPVTIVINAVDDQSGIEKVIVTIDDSEIVLSERPFTYYWDDFSFAEVTLHVTAVDNSHNSVELEKKIFSIF